MPQAFWEVANLCPTEVQQPDSCLGNVICGGFSLPLRSFEAFWRQTDSPLFIRSCS